MAAGETHSRARFGTFELDRRTGELWKDGRKVKLQEQPFRILELLLADPGEVVTREQLRATLWPADTFVDFEDSLNAAIRKLRQALDDSAENPRFVQTLPKRGYRFIAPMAVEPQNKKESSGRARSLMRARLPANWLSPLTGLAALVVVVLSAAVWWPQLHRSPHLQSIAVLPLENLSGDPDQEYFADGMTDELITNLAKIPSLRVMSRSATMPYKRTRKPVREIAHDLNVDAVIEGSVLRSGNEVRITAQLIQGATDHHLWAESYTRDAREVLALQREVSDAIAQQVRVRTASLPTPRSAVRSVNPQAYDLYLLGQYHSNKRDGEALNRAIGYFEKAIAIDPDFAPAYAGLADVYRERDVWAGLGIGTHAGEVRAAALKAIELDDTLAEAHYELGEARFQYDWDWRGTEAEYKRALELNPNLAAAHSGYARFFQSMRRHAEAIEAAKRATDLDPLSPTSICDEGRILYRARQYDRAIERYQRALEFDATFRPALSRLAEAYAQSGQYAASLATLDRLRLVRGPGEPLSRPLGRLFAVMGRKADALAIAHQIENESEGTAGGEEFALAVIYAGLGEYDRAMTQVERGVATRSLLPFTLVDPMLDALQTYPQFRALLAKMNLPSEESAR